MLCLMYDLAPPLDLPPLVRMRPCPGAPIALQQSALWLEASRRLGAKADVEEIGRTRATVLRRRLPLVGDIAVVSRADLRLDADLASGLRSDLGARHLVINAETTDDARMLAAAGFHRIAAPRVVADLALHSSLDTMAARLSPKWRNRLRHGQAQGLVIRRRPLPADPNHWLFRAEASQARRLWYEPVPARMVAELADCKPGAAQVFTAYHRGARVAAMLFIRHGVDATYQIGWSNEDGRALSAGPACMWRAMVELQALGAERLDLGAADRRAAPGLAHFKRGTGAQMRALGGSWLDTSWALRSSKRARGRAFERLTEAAIV